METQLLVHNLKCEGCAATIKKSLKKMIGIEDVKIITEEGEVDIIHNEKADLNKVKEKLNELGYPLTGTDLSGLEKLATSLKSYISCAIGRLSKT